MEIPLKLRPQPPCQGSRNQWIGNQLSILIDKLTSNIFCRHKLGCLQQISNSDCCNLNQSAFILIRNQFLYDWMFAWHTIGQWNWLILLRYWLVYSVKLRMIRITLVFVMFESCVLQYNLSLPKFTHDIKIWHQLSMGAEDNLHDLQSLNCQPASAFGMPCRLLNTSSFVHNIFFLCMI